MALPLLSSWLLACAPQISQEGEGVGSEPEALSRKCGGSDRVYGFDVSIHQGTVDWEKTKTAKIEGQAVAFVAARVSDGLYTKDGDLFLRNWKGMKDAGFIRGAYQFFRPEQDGHEQARLFLDAIEAAGGYEPGVDLPPTIDIEVVNARYTNKAVPYSQIQDGVQAWLEDVAAELHVQPIVYSLSGVSDALGTRFSGYPLWVANFYQTCPRMPAAWADWQFHQYDDRGRVPGVTQAVDYDVWNGTRAQLDAFIKASDLQ